MARKGAHSYQTLSERIEFSMLNAQHSVVHLRTLSTLILALAIGLFAFPATAQVLLQENFDAIPNGSLPAGWLPVDGEWAVQDGRLVGRSPNTQTQTRIVFGDPNWSDIEIEAELTFLSAVNAARWTALIYRADPQGGPPYQLFTIRQNASAYNGVELAYRTPQHTWDVAIATEGPYEMKIGSTHHVRIVVKGTTARYYLDGQLVIETDTLVREGSGQVGLHVNGSTVAFDNVVVRAVSE